MESTSGHPEVHARKALNPGRGFGCGSAPYQGNAKTNMAKAITLKKAQILGVKG
jgi:hypothetical protein